MTKLRTPDSIEDACTQAKALLSADTIAMALSARGLRCSSSLVDKWCDQDAPQTPSLEQALEMEQLLIKTGNAPIFTELFTRMHRPEPVSEAEAAEQPHVVAARIVQGAAKMMADFVEAEHDRRLDDKERRGLLADTDKLRKAITTFRQSLFSKHRPR